MMIRTLSLALLASAGLAAGGAPAQKELDKPGQGQIDKPGRAAIPTPIPLPPDAKKEQPEREEKGKEKPSLGTGHNPFRKRASKPKYAVPCRITYSDGTVQRGWAWRRANSFIRIFNRAQRAHEEYWLAELKKISVRPETVTFERDWRWKNQGSSIKVFLETGYIWHQYETTFVTKDGDHAKGDCSGQFYLLTLDGERTKWYLYKRHNTRDRPHKKREEIEPLVYVKTVEFGEEFLKEPEEKGADAKATPKAEDEKPNPPAEDNPDPAPTK